MGKNKKMIKFPFFLKPEPSWPWRPTCGNPTKTLSFRATMAAAEMVKTTINHHSPPPPPLLTNTSDELLEDSASIESVIQGLRSERLFFEPGETSSILEEAKAKEEVEEEEEGEVVHAVEKVVPFKESVAMEMESTDPFLDFKRSMAEMVEANDGLKKGSWEGLQELLSWYLAVNGKNNHGYIIGAFFDLLVSLNAPDQSCSSSSRISDDDQVHEQSLSDSNLISPSPVSALSFTSSSSSTCSASPCLSYLLEEGEDDRQKTLLVIDNASSS